MSSPSDWSRLSHEQLYQAVHTGPGRAASAAAEERWARIEASVSGIERRIGAAMARSSGGWEGAAADTTRAAVSPMGQWALDAAGDARLTAGAVLSQAEHASELRRLLPPPPPDPPPVAGRIGRLPATADAAAQQAAAAADAKRLMHAYANHSYENDRYLDFWTVPPSVTVDSARVGPASAGPADGAAGGLGTNETGSVQASGVGSAGGGGGPGGTVPGGVGPGGVGPGGVEPGRVGPSAPTPSGAAGGAGPGGTGPGGVGPSVPTASGAAGGLPPAPIPPGGLGVAERASGGAGAVSGGAAPGGSGSGRNAPIGVPAGTGSGSGESRPVTAGGRGPSRAASGLLGGTAVRPVVPEVPRSAPLPGWRDILPGADPGRSGRAEPPVRAGMLVEEPVARSAASRASPASGLTGIYPPMMAGGAGSHGGEHRRPSWLLDGSGAFDDDRWFPPAVITPDDGLPPPALLAPDERNNPSDEGAVRTGAW